MAHRIVILGAGTGGTAGPHDDAWRTRDGRTALFQRMTEHNTEIEFVDLQVMVPVTSQADSRQAPYRLNGVVRVRNGTAGKGR